MEEQQKSIDEIFRQSLGDYREAPPAAAWERVAGRLDEEDGPRRRGFFMRWPWISLLLLLLVGGVWFMAAHYSGNNHSTTAGAGGSAPVANIPVKAPAPATSSKDTTATGNASTTGSPKTNTNTHKAADAGKPVAAINHPASAGHTHIHKNAAATRRHTSGDERARHSSTKRPATAARRPSGVSSPSGNNKAMMPDSSGAVTAISPVAGRPRRERHTSGSGQHTARVKAPHRHTSPGIAASEKAVGRKKSTATEPTATDRQEPSAQANGEQQPVNGEQTGTQKRAASAGGAKSRRYAAKTPSTEKRAPVKQHAGKKHADHRITKAPAAKSKTTAGEAAAADEVAKTAVTEKTASARKSKTNRQIAVAGKQPATRKIPAEKEETATAPAAETAAKPPVAKKIASAKATRATKADLPLAAGGQRAKKTAADKGAVSQGHPVSGTAEEPAAKKQRPAGAATSKGHPVTASGDAPGRKRHIAETGNGNPAKNPSAQAANKAGSAAAKAGRPARSEPRRPVAEKARPAEPPVAAEERPAKQPKAKTAKQSKEGRKSPPVAARKNTPAKTTAATPVKPEPAAPAPRVPETQTFTFKPAEPQNTATAAGKGESATEDAEDDKETGGGGGGGGGGASPASARKRKTFFSLAALAGYELALQKPAPNMVSGGFRLLWHFDPGIALGIQPAFRYGDVSMTALSPSAAYQQRASVQVDSTIRRDTTGRVIYRSYGLRQSFDSIIITGVSAGGPMWQLELPLILSYKIAQAWHLYGGASVNFSGRLSTTSGSRQTYTTALFDSVISRPGTVQAPRPASSFDNYFATSSLPALSTYVPENDVLKDAASVRFGYLFGLGYEWKRIIFDASIHQQVSGYSNVNQPLQNVYASPSVRLSLGYYLIPPKNRSRGVAE